MVGEPADTQNVTVNPVTMMLALRPGFTLVLARVRDVPEAIADGRPEAVADRDLYADRAVHREEQA